MSKVLLLGAGLVSQPLVRYLLDKSVGITAAANITTKEVKKLLDDHPNGLCKTWVGDDLATLDQMVKSHDLTISLLPAPMHPTVAKVCLDNKKNLVTTSYVSPEMRALDEQAKKADLLFLNEIGVDPGIDHMSAMKIIHKVQNEKGKILAFRSYCGGLPAPQTNDNPWGYKISWHPVAVLRAGTNSARYLKNGQMIEVPPNLLFLARHPLPVDGVGRLEAYPNRDAMGYKDLYGLHHVRTLYRGTLRYPGWCETLRRVGELGLFDEKKREGMADKTWAELIAKLIRAKDIESIREKTAEYLWLPPENPILDKFEWLGLFSDRKIGHDEISLMECLAQLMMDKMSYGDKEQDMLVMHHDFVADYGHRQERITSSLVTFGIPGGASSMARTVGLPAAIAATMILEGKIKRRGVQIPVHPDIYNPILKELTTLDISLKEQTFPL